MFQLIKLCYFINLLTWLIIICYRIICGLTAFTTKQHIIRASLEAVCFQTRDILEAMNKDCGYPLTKLHTDGKMSTNSLLMQLQADLSGIPVCKWIIIRAKKFAYEIKKKVKTKERKLVKKTSSVGIFLANFKMSFGLEKMLSSNYN